MSANFFSFLARSLEWESQDVFFEDPEGSILDIWGAGKSGGVLVEIEEKNPDGHENDAPRQADGIDRKEGNIQDGFPARQVLREQQVDDRLAEKNDHDDDAPGRPIEIFQGASQVDFVQGDQRPKQPGREGPHEQENRDPNPIHGRRGFYMFH